MCSSRCLGAWCEYDFRYCWSEMCLQKGEYLHILVQLIRIHHQAQAVIIYKMRKCCLKHFNVQGRLETERFPAWKTKPKMSGRENGALISYSSMWNLTRFFNYIVIIHWPISFLFFFFPSFIGKEVSRVLYESTAHFHGASVKKSKNRYLFNSE